MTIEQYEALTGQTVTPDEEPMVLAKIARATRELEAALGYSLTPQTNIYSELGKSQYSYLSLRETLPVPANVLANLLPADPPVGDVKVFPLQLKDKHALVQPFKVVHRAKIALVLSDTEFITLVDLKNAIPQYTHGSWGKWIEIDVPAWTADPVALFNFTNMYAQGHPKQAKFMLAVDADYVDVGALPEIHDILADMVQYSLDPNNSIVMSNIKSESVDGHSWSKGETVKPPIDGDSHSRTVSLFAGPYGVKRNRVPVK